jgi:hypothetical protein
MRTRAPFILLAVLVLLACLWLFRSAPSAPRAADLSVVFLGLTNDPGRSVYPVLSVLPGVSGGRGLHALFAVTNISQGRYVQFGISTVETHRGDTWRAYDSKVFPAALGALWSPGYSALYAVPWPEGLPTDTPWRLRLWVAREPLPELAFVNQRLGRELFRPQGRHAVTSSSVTPLRLTGFRPAKSRG